jgi:8-oxo-dGTP diphosphatase
MAIRFGSAVVVEKDGKLLMVQSAKEAVYGKWVIPGGGIEEGETVEQAGEREVFDETGLTVEIVGRLFEKTVGTPENGRHITFSRALYKEGEIVPSDELLDAAFLTRAQIAEFRDSDALTPLMLEVLDELGWFSEKGR